MERRRTEGRVGYFSPLKRRAIRCNCSIRRGITGEGRSKDEGGATRGNITVSSERVPTLSTETTKPRS